MDIFAPCRSRYITLRPHAPWFNDSLRVAKQDKRRLERKWRKTRLEVDRQRYRDSCDDYHNLLRKAKSTYHIEKLASCDQRDLFREIEKMTKGKRQPILPKSTSECLLADLFADYFTNKVTDLRLCLDSPSITLSVPLDESNCSTKFDTFQTVMPDQVHSVLKNSPTKTCNLDPIPTILLKECLDVLLTIITSIINSSLVNGVVPDSFKVARITPLIKKPNLDPDILSHYRPVSNLPFLSKVLERIVAAQLLDHLNACNLFPKLQSGYRKFHSTETTLLRVQNDLLESIDNGHEALLILLDFSAAFDTIDHDILFQLLHRRFGLSGTVLNWIVSFFHNRQYFVSTGDLSSRRHPLRFGVPQGSVLGPLLFCLYISPLEQIFASHDLKAMLYADDTQLYVVLERSTLTTSVQRVNRCLGDIKSWSTSNKLVLNENKTEIIHIQSKFSRNITNLPQVVVSGVAIDPKNNARNLGVIFDDNLLLQKQINSVCSSAYLALYSIGKIRRYLDLQTTEKLVHAFISSRLDLCNSLLYGLPNFQLDKLQHVQNCAARLVTRNNKYAHITPILRKLHWLPIKARIEYKILLLTYKSLKGLAPDYLTSLLTPYKPKRTLRSSKNNLLQSPYTSTKAYGERSFRAAAPKLWNHLPDSIKNIDSLDTFKSNLKTFLFKKYYNI